MSKLLNDEELRKALVRNVNENSIHYQVRIFNVIQSQKIAHADMVIGEDGLIWHGSSDETKAYTAAKNHLRKEQRERNK